MEKLARRVDIETEHFICGVDTYDDGIEIPWYRVKEQKFERPIFDKQQGKWRMTTEREGRID